MESLIQDKILKHIEEQALLRENQHGFSKGKFCLTNLLEFFEKVRLVNVGEPVDIVYSGASIYELNWFQKMVVTQNGCKSKHHFP